MRAAPDTSSSSLSQPLHPRCVIFPASTHLRGQSRHLHHGPRDHRISCLRCVCCRLLMSLPCGRKNRRCDLHGYGFRLSDRPCTSALSLYRRRPSGRCCRCHDRRGHRPPRQNRSPCTLMPWQSPARSIGCSLQTFLSASFKTNLKIKKGRSPKSGGLPETALFSGPRCRARTRAPAGNRLLPGRRHQRRQPSHCPSQLS